MSDRNVVDLLVIDLSVAVREYVPKADNVSRIRYLLRNLRSGLVRGRSLPLRRPPTLVRRLLASSHLRGIARGYSL